MTFWYTIDIPRTKPCAEVNPILWKHFTETYKIATGQAPIPTDMFTEELVVQWLDQNVAVSITGESTID